MYSDSMLGAVVPAKKTSTCGKGKVAVILDPLGLVFYFRFPANRIATCDLGGVNSGRVQSSPNQKAPPPNEGEGGLIPKPSSLDSHDQLAPDECDRQ